MGGYSLPDAFDPKHVCKKCEKLLRNPVQSLSCGHRYCQTCFEELFSGDGDTADCIYPDCTEKISRSQYYIDRAAAKELSKVQVKCANRKSGCEWTGLIGEYDVHIDSCEFGVEHCPNEGCDVTYQRRECKSHAETCKKRTVNCEFCNDPIKLEQKESHRRQCSGLPVKCPDCQTELLSRRELEEHMHPVNGVCPNTKLPCRFTPFGCREVVVRTKMKDHLKSGQQTHLGQLLDEVVRLREGSVLSSGASAAPDEASADRVNKLETLCQVLHADVQRAINGADAARQETQMVRELKQELERKELAIRELRWRLETLATTSYDGTLLWRIDNVNQLRREAQDGTCTSIYSPVFFAGRRGYKLCSRLYFNGDGVGQGQYLSLFLVVTRGPWDPLLPWPFAQTVTFELLNQSGDERHITESFRPATNSVSFKRPVTDMNIASGCPQFCPLQVLEDHKDAFLKDDVMFIKITVNLTGLPLH